MKKLLVLVLLLIAFLIGWTYLGDKVGKILNKSILPRISVPGEKVRVLTEESVVIDTVKKVGPSVITVALKSSGVTQNPSFNFGPFSIFGTPNLGLTPTPDQPQSIGSGFVISSDGLIVTNKHVVSDVAGKYQIITNEDKKYDVQKIYRDPLNDVAILKIDTSGDNLKPVPMGDSSNLQVGQFAIAIGTALGEFRNTVTTGVISGLGRGIIAGDSFQGFAEKLDNVIQTDAAINPGNSGGPLLNSSGEVIGVNTAVVQGGQNIGFALPINVIKASLDNFNKTGQFNRPYLGVAYRMLDKQVAILNNVPAGAVVDTLVPGSPAEKAGVQAGDIIVKIDDKDFSGTNVLSSIIASKKVGDTIKITIWRDGKTIDTQSTLTTSPGQ